MVQFLFACRSVGMFHQRSANAVRRGRDGHRSRRRLLRGGLSLGWLAIACAAATNASGQSRPASSIDRDRATASVQWLVDRAVNELPRTIDGDKGWGDTKKIWSGVKVRLDGLKVKTHRRYREVQHGRWIRYEVTLPRPSDRRGVEVTIESATPIVDPESGDQRWRIQSSVVAPMKFSARIQRWNLGAKLFSLSVEGKMKVRMQSTATIGFYPDYSNILPDLVIDPRVESAKMRLESFEVDRVSHIGGDAAEAWGEVMQEVLVERFVKAQDDRLADRLNKSIDKKRDDLRISMSDWISGFQANDDQTVDSPPVDGPTDSGLLGDSTPSPTPHSP